MGLTEERNVRGKPSELGDIAIVDSIGKTVGTAFAGPGGLWDNKKPSPYVQLRSQKEEK